MLTPLIALIALLIAYRQWRTSQNKLRLDLFEKRLKVYEATFNLISTIAGSGEVPENVDLEYRGGIKSTEWLFDESIMEYLKEIWGQCQLFLHYQSSLVEIDNDERIRNSQRRADIREWFGKQYLVVEKKFKPFLKIRA